MTGILTVLTLAMQNADKTAWGEIWLPAGLAGAYGLLIWALFMIIPFFRRAAALSATYIVLITMLWNLIPFQPALPLMVGVPFIVLISAIPTSHKIIPSATLIIGVACLLSLGFFAQNTRGVQASSIQSTEITLRQTPDIYFIDTDRFPSPDALRECGLDPTAFVTALRDRGFFVPDNQMSDDPVKPNTPSHTTRTLRYLASVLNLGVDIPFNMPYLEAGEMVKNPEVARILQGNGYTYYHIGSWFPETAYSLVADYNYIYPSYSFSSRLNSSLFAATVIDRSGFRTLNFIPFLTSSARAKTEMGRQMWQIESLEKIALSEGSPKFVFIHLLLPHPDYYWNADGTEQTDMSKSDMERYLEQVRFTMTKILEMVDVIDDSKAIIIIQSDEGIAFTDGELNKQLSNIQWNGTLSAWRIPGVDNLDGVNIRNVLKVILKSLE